MDNSTKLGVEAFVGSPGFIQPSASRHRLKSITMWGQISSEAERVRQGDRRIGEVRADLAIYDPYNIDNTHKTLAQYRCLQSPTHPAAGLRRRICGSRAMKA